MGTLTKKVLIVVLLVLLGTSVLQVTVLKAGDPLIPCDPGCGPPFMSGCSKLCNNPSPPVQNWCWRYWGADSAAHCSWCLFHGYSVDCSQYYDQ